MRRTVVQAYRARRAVENVPCEHCPKTGKGRKRCSTGYTLFVRWHPFKEGWEIRRCVDCGRLTAQDARR